MSAPAGDEGERARYEAAVLDAPARLTAVLGEGLFALGAPMGLALGVEPGDEVAWALQGSRALSRWSLATGRRLGALTLERAVSSAPLWSPQRRLFAASFDDGLGLGLFGGDDGALLRELWNASWGGVPSAPTRTSSGRALPLAWAPDGRFLAGELRGPGALRGRELRVWDTFSTLPPVSLPFGTLASYAPDGSSLLTAEGTLPRLVLVDASGAVRWRAPFFAAELAAAWEPDGSALYVAAVSLRFDAEATVEPCALLALEPSAGAVRWRAALPPCAGPLALQLALKSARLWLFEGNARARCVDRATGATLGLGALAPAVPPSGSADARERAAVFVAGARASLLTPDEARALVLTPRAVLSSRFEAPLAAPVSARTSPSLLARLAGLEAAAPRDEGAAYAEPLRWRVAEPLDAALFPGAPTALWLGEDGALALAGGEAGALALCDLESGALRWRLEGLREVVRWAFVTAHGAYALAGDEARALGFDLRTGLEAFDLSAALEGRVVTACDEPSGGSYAALVERGDERYLCVSDEPSFERLRWQQRLVDGVAPRAVALRFDAGAGAVLGAFDARGYAGLFDARSGAPLGRDALAARGPVPWLDEAAGALALRVAVDAEGAVESRLLRPRGAPVALAPVALARSGNRAITAAVDGSALLWDLTARCCVGQVVLGRCLDALAAAALTRSGTTALLGTARGLLLRYRWAL